ncbi:hypothetical protein [Tsukamurella sp. 1534]|uniref:hypothetical protein n=1 Tax=Tsukamurella sp. 1534 TaxID=1151061 RepID=UPI0002D5D653|nr:hypothetical protein [Tsukamurella sp. 1534]
MTELSRGDRVRLRSEISTYGTVLAVLTTGRASVAFDDGRAVVVSESRLVKVVGPRDRARPATASTL